MGATTRNIYKSVRVHQVISLDLNKSWSELGTFSQFKMPIHGQLNSSD